MKRISVNPVGVFSALGFTATILWCKLMGHTPGFLLATAGLGDWANARAFWLVGILVAAAGCLALPRLMRRFDPVLRYTMPSVAMIGAASFALSFHQVFFDQKILAVVGIIISGFGYFWFMSRFVLLLTLTQGFTCMVIALAAAFPLRQAILSLLDATTTPDSQVMLAMALPLVAVCMFEFACSAARRRDKADHAGGVAVQAANDQQIFGVTRLSRTAYMNVSERRYLMIIMLAMALLLSVVRACSISAQWGTDHTSAITSINALFTVAYMTGLIALFAYFAIIRMRRYPVTMRFQFGILLVLAGLMMGALHTQLSWVPSSLIDEIFKANDPFALLLFWSTVAIAIDAFDMPADRVVGLAGVAYAVPSILWVVEITDANALGGAFMLVAAYLLFAIFMVCSWLGHKTPDKTETPVRSGGDAHEAPVEAAEITASTELGTLVEVSEQNSGALLTSVMESRCSEIAVQYKLSPREKDVLLLLAQGRTGSSIQEELVVAASTVKTHMQHIYAKTEVRDRQELMHMILGNKE